MAVDKGTGTFLSDLVDPEVIAGMIEEKLIPNIVFAPLATIDYTLQGRAGDTVTLPYYESIAAAETVNEGESIPIKKLTAKTKQVKIKKIGLGVTLTDEAILSGYGQPLDEATTQIVQQIGSAVDKELLDALDGNTKNVYTPSGAFDPEQIPKALALYGEDIGRPGAIIVSPDFYADLLNVKTWIPASELAANTVIQGAVGMAYGVQVIVSERVDDNFHIVRPGALALFIKRDTLVEYDRDIVDQNNYIVGSKLFAPYLYKPGEAIKIVVNGG